MVPSYSKVKLLLPCMARSVMLTFVLRTLTLSDFTPEVICSSLVDSFIMFLGGGATFLWCSVVPLGNLPDLQSPNLGDYLILF